MIKSIILNHHVIYGEWDDINNDEFLVFYHPNGEDCTVFLMSGMDYGGGIQEYFSAKSADIDRIVCQEGKSASKIKEEVAELKFKEKP